MGPDPSEPVLDVRALRAGYGASQVLRNISFTIERGEMLAVIGRNGVGKTTLLETLCGLTTLHGGEIVFNGAPIEALPTYKRNRLGLAWAPQEREVFPSLTVEEHLTVISRDKTWPLDRIYELFPRLQARRRNFANQLSGGEQQMLTIARALATNPSLLLLDEPVEGLAPRVVQEMIQAIDHLRARGELTIIMVEQKYDIALTHSNRCIVLDRGEIVHMGPSGELLADQARLDRLLGVME